ncbi:MAG TPA: HEAT repeat domain-containing protein [Planctomycetota bacterium]|nr:HEAT repeat domain-containing protein [Planctomycetota bacterium]
MTLASLLCLSVLTAPPQGDLRLPPPTPKTAAAAAPRPLSEIERFRRDLMEMQGSQPKVESKLQEMSTTYPAIEALILEVARSARANEMENLMVVAKRFGKVPAADGGKSHVPDELLFQLLARPLGDATRSTVATMALLKGDQAKVALQQCIRGRIAAVRRYATELLAPMLTPEDLDFALQLSSEQTLDLQLRGIDLLAAIPHERGPQRLVELLSKEPALAGAACAALIALGERAVPYLQRLCAEPRIDRAYEYCAFALAQIQQTSTATVLPASVASVLLPRLKDPEPLTRSLAALALADLAYRSEPTGTGSPDAVVFPDAQIVEALIDLVAPIQFVPNLDMLRHSAEERLVRATGRVGVGRESLPWREWWKEQKVGFLGVRARLAVDRSSAQNAVVVLRHEQRFVRVLAEGLADAAPQNGAVEIVLTAEQMFDLVQALEAGGFGDTEAMRVQSALPIVRSLQLQLPSGRTQVAMPATPHPRFDALVQLVQDRVDSELWQLYRDPKAEPDRAAFWRAERRWLDAHPDALERDRRLLERVVQHWPSLPQPLRARAIEQFLSRSDRKQLLREEDGERILAALEPVAELSEMDLRLLELAAGVRGDRIWPRCIVLAARAGDGRTAVRSVFAVMGPDAVLTALSDANPVVRRAAIEEVVVGRDQRAAPRIIELLADAEPEVRRAAALASGQMQIEAAAPRLIATIVAEDTPPAMRRDCLRALGRVGGDQAFSVLQRALAAPGQDDKEAALRGLGELRDPRSAQLLAELVVLSHGKDLGTLARYYLQRQGGVLAVPALRQQLLTVQDEAIRQELVLLLGNYQDPGAVPDLMDLLRVPRRAGEAEALLVMATGVDLAKSTDRIGDIEAWWRKNKASPQWQWLLDGLHAAEVATLLKAEQFAPGAGLAPVPELARLLAEAREPRFQVLAAAVLRSVTGQDFGVVTPQTPQAEREGIAARYRLLVENARAAQGR